MNLSFRQTGVCKVRGRSYRGSDYADGAVEARSKLFVGVIVALLCAICPTVSSAQSQVAEYRLKAAFLFHFAEFVEWPPENASGPFVICIVGEDPFHGDLEEAVQGLSLIHIFNWNGIARALAERPRVRLLQCSIPRSSLDPF